MRTYSTVPAVNPAQVPIDIVENCAFFPALWAHFAGSIFLDANDCCSHLPEVRDQKTQKGPVRGLEGIKFS